jgi:hypothetical protein
MTNATIAHQLNRFSNKDGDLHRYRNRIRNFSHDEKLRLVENLEAGDEVLDAIRDARGFEYTECLAEEESERCD